MSGTVLILGASGRFGRHAADAFWNRGWRVRIFDRANDDLIAACEGVDVIVNAWNPPYTEWARTVPELTQRVIEAARTSGATVLIPGNVYVYGRDAHELFTENTLQLADNPLGRIRIEMEAAYAQADVPTIILRAGDFIDTEASGNWFDEIITAKSARGIFTAPGNPDVPHAWAFLPDMARAAVQLAERRADLDRFEVVPFAGFTLTLRELAGLVEASTGRTQRIRRFPWFALWLASPFWRLGRHLVEMSYLWSKPHRLDDSKFKQLLPNFRATSPLIAIASVLQGQVHPDQPMAGSLNHVVAE
jgi:nucleoside-diphosphate-sugar epimerase